MRGIYLLKKIHSDLKRTTIYIITAILAMLLLTGAVIGYDYYQKVFAPNVPSKLEQAYVHIPNGSSFEAVVDSLSTNKLLKDKASFEQVAEWMEYKRPEMRSGRYKLQANWSNRDLIRHLRGGRQEAVKVVMNNCRMSENVAAKVAQFIAPDSLELWQLFQNEKYLEELGYSTETLISLFIPNTYELYWNTTAKEFVTRMQKEHQKFWEKDNREVQLESLDMSKEEVYTLASIVEKETLQNSEKRRMAGVYLNRLKRGMLLQADPTSVFATRDFDAKRVLNKHTQFDSPYNTYMYTGLPPGPIAMASIASIDAVLNSETHKYIYFCAKGDGSGLHNFGRTLSQHNQNALTYKRNLRKRGLR